MEKKCWIIIVSFLLASCSSAPSVNSSTANAESQAVDNETATSPAEDDDVLDQGSLGESGNVRYSFEIIKTGEEFHGSTPVNIILSAINNLSGRELGYSIINQSFSRYIKVTRRLDIIRIRISFIEAGKEDETIYDECYRLDKGKTAFERVGCSLYRRK